jgi:hypothetical protein
MKHKLAAVGSGSNTMIEETKRWWLRLIEKSKKAKSIQ